MNTSAPEQPLDDRPDANPTIHEQMERLMRRYLLILAGVLFCGTAQAHDPYTKWQQANGASCCNKTDCRPAVVRWQPTGWQVRLHGTWCDIPADKVRNYKTPDGGPHVCAPLSPLAGKCQMYCFVHGETRL